MISFFLEYRVRLVGFFSNLVEKLRYRQKINSIAFKTFIKRLVIRAGTRSGGRDKVLYLTFIDGVYNFFSRLYTT